MSAGAAKIGMAAGVAKMAVEIANNGAAKIGAAQMSHRGGGSRLGDRLSWEPAKPSFGRKVIL